MSVEVHPQFVVDAEGKTQSVLLSIKDYEALMDQIEDLEDTIVVEHLRATQKPEDFEPWDEFTARLKAEGKLPHDL